MRTPAKVAHKALARCPRSCSSTSCDVRQSVIGVPLQRHLSLHAVRAILFLLALLFHIDSSPGPGLMRGGVESGIDRDMGNEREVSAR
jgi:hypothetical protein